MAPDPRSLSEIESIKGGLEAAEEAVLEARADAIDEWQDALLDVEANAVPVPFPTPDSWDEDASPTEHAVLFEPLDTKHLPLLKKWSKAKHLKSEFIKHGRPNVRQYFYVDHPSWVQHVIYYLGTPIGHARSEPTAHGLKLCLYLGEERYLEQHLSGFLFELYTRLTASQHPGCRIYVEVPKEHKALGMVKAAGYRQVPPDSAADIVVLEWDPPARSELNESDD